MKPKHKNPGNFRNRPGGASEAGKIGGPRSSANFKYNRERAVIAGRKGGQASKRRPKREL
jgi:general stress protein YciG